MHDVINDVKPIPIDYICMFFFFDMSTQERGGEIRTSDFHFMRRGS